MSKQYLSDRFVVSTGTTNHFLKGDGSLDNRTFLTAEADTLQTVTTRGATTTANITAAKLITTGGNSSQFVKGDGTLDSAAYTTNLGTVTSVTVVSANGFTGAIATQGTTPAITLTLQNATSGQTGQLTSTDWQTFNNKQAPLGFTAVPDTRTVSTTAPLTGGGALSGNLTLAMAAAASGVSGYLTAGDWAIFNGKQANLGFTPVNNTTTVTTTAPLSGGGALSSSLTLSMAAAASGVNGYLTGADWNTFNGKQAALGFTPVSNARLVSTTAPLTGGGALTSDLTISMPAAAAGVSGYLTGTDYNTFAAKQAPLGFTPANSTTTITATAPLTGGGSLASNMSIGIPQATGAVSGYLLNTDWTTFNGKQAALNGTGLVRMAGTSVSYDNTSYYTSANPSGFTSFSGTVTSVAALTLGTTGTDLSSTVANGTTTPVITLNVPDASGTARGVLKASDWTLFNSKTSNLGTVTSVAALTIGTTGADVNSSVANSTTTPVITLNIPDASATNRGVLKTSDWTTFNSKAPTNNPTFTGTVTVPTPTNPTDAANKAYADGLVVGLVDDRGNWDASGNLFPATGGSGAAGAILKGDLWYVSVPGTLGGKAVQVGDSFRAMTDSPGQTATNWAQMEGNVGYVPANEQRSILTTAPLTGGGNLTADRTISMPKATGAVDGFLAAADFAIFAAKVSAPANTITGTGTANNIGKFTGASTLGNGSMTDDGVTVSSGVKLAVTGTITATSSVKVGDDVAAASAANVGAIRYTVSGNNSYVDMVMQTGAGTYAWVNIVQNNW